MNVPQLRFNGFSGNWEETIFSEFIVEQNSKTSDIKKYPLSSLTLENGVTSKSERYERSFLVSKDGETYNILKSKWFAYNPMNIRFGAVAPNLLNCDVCVSGYYDTFEILNNKTLFFWKNYLLSYIMIKHYNIIATGSLLEKKRVHFSQFLNIVKPLPTLPEQEKIADFLSTLDEKIQTEQYILDNLIKQKKGYTQKLFSQELRFDGFTDDWEDVALGDVCEIKAGGDISKENVNETYSNKFCYPIYSNSLSNDGLYGYSNIFKVSGETVTVTGRGDIGKAKARYEKYFPIVRLLVLTSKNNDNVKFLEEVINCTKMFIESTGVPQLTSPQLSKIKIPLPSLAEQEKIADFLSTFDEKIDAQSNVVDNLLLLKKGLLQQLFC